MPQIRNQMQTTNIFASNNLIFQMVQLHWVKAWKQYLPGSPRRTHEMTVQNVNAKSCMSNNVRTMPCVRDRNHALCSQCVQECAWMICTSNGYRPPTEANALHASGLTPRTMSASPNNMSAIGFLCNRGRSRLIARRAALKRRSTLAVDAGIATIARATRDSNVNLSSRSFHNCHTQKC